MILTKEHQEALVSNYVREGHSQEQCIGFIDGIEAITKAPLVDHQKQREVYIPVDVNDELPDDDGRYFVMACTDGMIDHVAPMVVERFIDKWVVESEDEDNFQVTHWLKKATTSIVPNEDTQRLYEWIMDDNRPPANTYFTEGGLRNVAKEIEFRLSQHQ